MRRSLELTEPNLTAIAMLFAAQTYARREGAMERVWWDTFAASTPRPAWLPGWLGWLFPSASSKRTRTHGGSDGLDRAACGRSRTSIAEEVARAKGVVAGLDETNACLLAVEHALAGLEPQIDVVERTMREIRARGRTGRASLLALLLVAPNGVGARKATRRRA